MNIEQFENLVDRFGEVPTGWPDDIRAEALTFLDQSADARRVVAEAAALRDMFRNDVPTKAPAGLSDRIFAAAAADEGWQPPSARKELFPAPRIPHPAVITRSWQPSYLVMATCFVVGLGLGLGLKYAPFGGDGHIDFATLFAVVGS
ncbi:MAG: hypothetical protein GC182_12025 [Rhodopseudomonas sp.]|nr:hypothetical protein [Rhodopseudomonas sp.]